MRLSFEARLPYSGVRVFAIVLFVSGRIHAVESHLFDWAPFGRALE
jgi:hypothetical protein